MALGLASCDNNGKVIVQDDTAKIEAFENLFSEIEALNSSFQFDSDLDFQDGFLRRGSFWNRLGFIASADFTGALIGSPGGGAGALSIGIVFSLVAMMNDPYVVVDDWMNLDWSVVEMIEFADSDVGALHNKFIGKILSEHSTLLDGSKSEAEIISIVSAKLNKHDIDSSVETMSSIMDSRANTLIQKILTSNDLVSSMDAAILLYPELKNELQIARVYLSGVERIHTKETMVRYTRDVLEVVRVSDIPDSSREIISSALTVYANSFVLW